MSVSLIRHGHIFTSYVPNWLEKYLEIPFFFSFNSNIILNGIVIESRFTRKETWFKIYCIHICQCIYLINVYIYIQYLLYLLVGICMAPKIYLSISFSIFVFNAVPHKMWTCIKPVRDTLIDYQVICVIRFFLNTQCLIKLIKKC